MELIPVSKNGEYLEVHPTALAAHKVLGWLECAKQVADDADVAESTESKKRGRPAKE